MTRQKKTEMSYILNLHDESGNIIIEVKNVHSLKIITFITSWTEMMKQGTKVGDLECNKDCYISVYPTFN